MLIFFLIKESFLYALNSLAANRIRTFLSLSGITIGIFAVISVFTVLDSLKNSIRDSIASLGEDVVYIQKWPWAMSGNYPWWEYLKRPLPTMEEAKKVKKLTEVGQAVSFMAVTQKNVQYKKNYIEDVRIQAVEYDYGQIKSMNFKAGRYFSAYEANSGRNKAILGADIAEELLGNNYSIGKNIKIAGRKVNIVGILEKEGEDMFGLSLDKTILLNMNYMRTIVDLRNERLNPFIVVKPHNKYSADDLIAELEGIMRSIRRLQPTEKVDFALNRASLISKGFEGIFSIVDLAGLIIGGFSILVGGFGIANIMFVSVKEQTRIIGIQKALGAKRYFVLFQFLFEAIILSLVGGMVGLIAVFIITLLLNTIGDMNFYMSAKNIIFGLSLSFSIGLIAGLLPALKASKQNPVSAMSAI